MKFSIRDLIFVTVIVAVVLGCLILAVRSVQMGFSLRELRKSGEEVIREMQRDGRLPNTSASAPNPPKRDP